MYEIELPTEIFGSTVGGVEQGENHDLLLSTIDLALSPSQQLLLTECMLDNDPQRGAFDEWTTSPSLTLRYESVAVDVEITVRETSDVSIVSPQTEKEISLDELHDGHECPVCGEAFDTATWENVTDFGDNDEAKWVYGCPVDDCDGTVVLTPE